MYIHNLDPIIVSLGPLSIRWYSLAYVGTALGLYFYLLWARKRGTFTLLTREGIDNLVFSLFLGVVLGGRLGYFLFYDPTAFWEDPLRILQVWKGGMAFHGGFIGAIIAIYLFARRSKLRFYQLADIIVAPIALGLFFGRIANFINAEVVGIPTTVPWCVVFPTVDNLCRHPSQLYEAAKNLLLFAILAYGSLQIKKRIWKEGTNFWLFVAGYGILRFLITFFREDPRWLLLSEGQWLSAAMAIIGICMLIYIYRKPSPSRR